jgi:hypothetical protein
MRIAFDPRSSGYPVVVIVALVASYCLLVGSDWAAAAFAAVGIVLMGILSHLRVTPSRNPARKPDRIGGLAHR